MDDVYVYLIDMPASVPEMVLPCDFGFTVYINARLAHNDRVRAYLHALRHIENDDWNKHDVQEIESEAHNGDRN